MCCWLEEVQGVFIIGGWQGGGRGGTTEERGVREGGGGDGGGGSLCALSLGFLTVGK